jgi:hypothetical protein
LSPAAPESTTAPAESAKAPKSTATTEAITAAKAAAAAEAIAAKSTSATGSIKAAALEALEPLTRKVTTRPVLSLAIQITGSASTAGSIETASP